MERVVSISWKALWQLLAALAAVWVLVETWQLWLLLFIALTLAAAMLPAARWGESKRIPRAVTVTAIYLGLILLFVLAGSLLYPMLSDQASQLFNQLPAMIENVKNWMGQFSRWVERFAVPVTAPTSPDLQGIGQTLITNTLKASAGVLGAVVGVLLVLFLAAYFVIDAGRIGRGLLAFVSPEHREEVVRLAESALEKIGGYARGQILVSLGVGIIIAIGLTILRVPYSLVIGTLAALLNVVPFIGSFIAFVLALVTAFNVAPVMALWTALLFGISNLIEGKVLMPYFLGRTTGLHPVAVLVALLVGAKLAGLVGAIVAVPLLAGVNALIEARYLKPAP